MAETVLYVATGGYQYFTVPAGVKSVDVVLNGGASVGGRLGGRVTGKLAVTPGQRLCVICGEQAKGHSGSSGGGTAFGAGGAGGDGKGYNGGDGGGGYSAIRLDSSSGTIKCVAGGAGGTSGDSGAGGEGGASTGESGSRGTSGSNSTGNATGGTQSQGGNGGTSSSGSQFNGASASDAQVARGGAGGSASNYCHGGGGGGGGWRSGGGGQASSAGYAPGGGGGGGSNYTGGLTGATSQQGTSTTFVGAVRFTWTKPAPANQPPTAPTAAKVNGVAEAPAMPTKDVGTVIITATLNDPDSGDKVRMLVRVSSDTNFDSGYYDYYSAYDQRGETVSVNVPSLKGDTHYYLRLYAQDGGGLYSTTYNSVDFWTNRAPIEPTLTAPADNATILALSSPVFTWVHNDLDPTDPMQGWQLQYRQAGTPTTAPGAWTVISKPKGSAGATTPTWTANPTTFKSNRFYEWQVRTIDAQATWGKWSLVRSFYTLGVSTPPIPVSPDDDVALDVNDPVLFDWQFVDPDSGDSQSRADLRYRLVGQDDAAWVTIFGAMDPGLPGKLSEWLLPANTFQPGYNYEWQVRTYDTLGGLGVPSGWSDSATFWTTGTPGSGGQPAVPALSSVQGALGCGEYRVYIYAQGGKQVIGEITPMTTLNFKRVRDDISNCVVNTNGFAEDCCDLYASLRCWLHEIVVFRSGVRVWEGPITRIGYSHDSVEIEAKDVLGYLYRRILRQGFNDAYQTVPGSSADPHEKLVVKALNVVDRAQWIIQNALAPHDPNILPYLTAFRFSDDAKQSRVIPDYSQSAWEQVDDMAATSGLDYTVIGRRIILWDTHRAIGRLPEMRDGDFSDPPIVTEYGMQLCNYMAVTNGSGVWGATTPKDQTTPFESYGPIEMVATGYSDSAAASSDVMTNAAVTKLKATFVEQAERNIAHRWPTPVIVRVPDNSTLSPSVGVGFDQLIPGVWIPLRSSATCREITQWQKLDSVNVTVDATGGEQVQVVMSPAPGRGQDPDEDAAAEEG
jgi:hypothetical protein